MLITTSSIQNYFREALENALRKSSVLITDSAQVYLVHLLHEFSRSEQAFAGTDYGDKVNMASLLERALLSESHEAQRIYRHLGDTSLYLLGFFNESTLQKIVSQSYYRDMGSSAYLQAASLARASAFGQATIFGELAERFDDLVKLVELISQYQQPKPN